MSNKTTLKRIALLGISALGLGLLSAVPASAARADTELTVDAITVTSPAPDAVDVGTLTSSTFSVSFSAASVNTDDADITLSLSKPSASSVSLTDVNGSNAAADGKVVTNTAKAVTLTSTTIGDDTGTDDLVTIVTGGVIAGATNTVAGTIRIKPDVPGTYVVTLTGSDLGTPSSANAVTATFTVVATAENNTSTALTNSISLAQATATPKVGSSVAANFLANVDDVANQAYDKSTSFTGYLSSYPAGGFAQVAVSTSAPTTDTEVWIASGGTSAAVTESQSGSTYTVALDGDSANEDYTGNTAVATNLVGAAEFSFTPVVAGTHVLTVWNDANADGKVSIGEAVQTLSITVTAATAFSAGQSTSIIQTADDNFDAAADEEVRVSKTAGTNGGTIALILKDTAGDAKGGMRVSAEVSGPGLVDVVTGATVYGDATVRADALTLASGVSTAKVHITADGTAGTSTITVKVQDATTLETLGTYTETMYFYGTVASLTATANFTVARASATERGCSNATTCDQADFADVPFVAIVAKDSAGNLVPGLTVSASITDPTVVQASTVTAVTSTAVSGPNYLTACVSTDCNGLGYYNASLAGTVGAASGKSTTVAYYTVLSDGTIIKSNAVTITIGGSAATGTETLTLDKSSYEQGEGMTVTLTAKDSAGNPVYDGYASPAVTFNKAIGGTAIAASYYVGGKVTSNDSLGRQTVYAPTASGAFTATATAASLATITATATVGDDAATTAATAASDAANEATDAANAATDAANAAAEAADAATAAAQDAQAAVADLAAQVATLIAGIKSQLTSLSNLIVKIQKKVKA